MGWVRSAEYIESQGITADDFHFLFCQILGTIFCQARPVRQEFIIIRFQGIPFVPSEMEQYDVSFLDFYMVFSQAMISSLWNNPNAPT